MEVNSAKRLHYHVLPFIVIACGLFVLSVIGVQRLANVNTPVTQLLTIRFLNFKPASNGLAHVSRHLNASTGGDTQAQKPGALNSVQTAGESAHLQAAVYSQ